MTMSIISLELNCDGCGACCMRLGHPRFLRAATESGLPAETHYQNLPPDLRREVDEYFLGVRPENYGQPCSWLDPTTRSCRHYGHRPQVCRDFELGGVDCHRARQDENIG